MYVDEGYIYRIIKKASGFLKIHEISLALCLLNTHGKQTRTAINAKKVFSTVVAE
jgi:hypothetical protein